MAVASFKEEYRLNKFLYGQSLTNKQCHLLKYMNVEEYEIIIGYIFF